MNTSISRLRALTFGMALLAAAVTAQAQLPPSKAAPQVGQKAPDFTLPDTSNKLVKLSDVLADSELTARRPNKNAPAVLLVFYRGYW